MSRLKFWESHVEAWRRSGLTQTIYCRQQGLNYKSFTVRVSQFRKKPDGGLPALIPIQLQPAIPNTAIRLSHPKGLRIDLPSNTSAAWLAELLKCLD